MERQIRLHLCDSVEDLTVRFLHGIKVQGLEKPWKAFTASWKKQFIPKIFGIPATFLNDDYTFVLVLMSTCYALNKFLNCSIRAQLLFLFLLDEKTLQKPTL